MITHINGQLRQRLPFCIAAGLFDRRGEAVVLRQHVRAAGQVHARRKDRRLDDRVFRAIESEEIAMPAYVYDAYLDARAFIRLVD